MKESQISKINDILLHSECLFFDDFCTRHGLNAAEAIDVLKKCSFFIGIETCRECGRKIIVTYHRRQRKFCCAEHKRRYFNKQRKKTKTAICLNCGKEFQTYSFRNSRFCSISCANYYRNEHKNDESEK